MLYNQVPGGACEGNRLYMVGHRRVSDIWSVMYIHKLVRLHHDFGLDNPLETEIFAFELKRIYCVIKYVLLFFSDKFHNDLFERF